MQGQSPQTRGSCVSEPLERCPQPCVRAGGSASTDLGGEKQHEEGQEAGSPPQSRWFQCINNSEHKRCTADNALLPALLTIVLQGIHYFNYFMIGKEKHRLKKDNARVIICLYSMPWAQLPHAGGRTGAVAGQKGGQSSAEPDASRPGWPHSACGEAPPLHL